MKHFMTLMALLVAATAGAQFDPIQPPYNPDVDMDGMISVEDLMALLSLFSSEFEAYPFALNEDTTVAIIHVGELDFFDCNRTCDTLEGNWKVIDFLNFGQFKDELEEIAFDGLAGFHTSAMLNVPLSGDGNVYFAFDNWGANGWGAQGYFEVRNCVCQTQVMRQIEYSYVEAGSSLFQAEVNEKLSDGWFPLGGMSMYSGTSSRTQAFWRWAE